MSKNTDRQNRPANGRWKKGTSGNPAGRPVGSRNESTLFFQELLNGRGEALIQKAIELSMNGDTRALSICWDRLLPSRKDRAIQLCLPKATDAKGVSAALASVVTAVAEGRITPAEAESLARILETQMRVVQFEVLAQRVVELEKAQTRTQTIESSDGPTLEWIAQNYSIQIRDSLTIAQPPPEHGNGPDAEERPLSQPGVSDEPSESTR